MPAGFQRPNTRDIAGIFFLVRPAGRTHLEVKVLYLPDKGKS
jgi:hypothetical protein